MELKAYTLAELASHVTQSQDDSNKNTPFSPIRLKSYLNNPRAEQSDHVLFEMRNEGKLVAYRTLLSDFYIDHNDNPQRFAWLSGNYVDPNYRRQGISTRLLQLAEAHWDGKLMYTNYAPSSKALYDQTGQFPLMTSRPGKRFYLRSASKELLGDRLGNKALLKTGDQLVNKLREGKLQKFQGTDISLCNIEKINSFDTEITKLIHQSLTFSFFQRDEGIFSWILDYPWVTDQKVDPLKYEFTYGAIRFENLLLKFTLPDTTGIGLLWLVIHNQKLSAPYVFTNNKMIFSFMARTLLHTMITQGCSYSTIRHPALTEHLLNHKKWFLSIREMPQKIFAHKKIVNQVSGHRIIQDGDGDVVFTG